jgi:hypothetical protein
MERNRSLVQQLTEELNNLTTDAQKTRFCLISAILWVLSALLFGFVAVRMFINHRLSSALWLTVGVVVDFGLALLMYAYWRRRAGLSNRDLGLPHARLRAFDQSQSVDRG